MPLYCYCPFATCGSKIPYEVVKPTVCPRCNKAFADAFKVARPAPAPEVRATVEIEEEDRPLTKSALLKRARAGITTKVKPRNEDPDAMAHVMNVPIVDETAPEPLDEDDAEGAYDPRAAKRMARQLAARINPDSIKLVEGRGDGKCSRTEVVRLEDLIGRGAS